MSGRSRRFDLTSLDSEDEKFDHDSWRFGTSNRYIIDRLLAYAAEQHVHSGLPVEDALLPPPEVRAQASGVGLIGPGQDAYYRYSLVDSNGLEGPASVAVVGRTPNQISPPPAPTILSMGGVLPSGIYYYAATWWTGDSRCETQAGPIASAVGTGGTITMEAVDPAASGWNIYRKGPMDLEWVRVASATNDDDPVVVDEGPLSGATPSPLPTSNTTFDRNSIEITIPDSEGDDVYQWRVYRTYDPTNWTSSLIAWTTDLVVVDQGAPGTDGEPKGFSESLGGVPKVQLDLETEGSLPSGLLTTPYQISMVVEGPVTVGYSPFQWVNEFDDLQVVAIRPRLMTGPPDERDVIVSLERRDLLGAWTEMERARCFIPTGEMVGEAVVLDSTLADRLAPGEALRLLVIQDGGGDPQTDADLVVSLATLVHYGSTTETHVWSP